MYQGKGHVHGGKFNKVSDFMDRWYVDPSEPGPRKSTEYRGALRNSARVAYRVAKRTLKEMAKNNG